ncbi:hypothetical protein ACTZWW_10435 [Salinarimonas sp. NSM]|uniref:hypothetical protein n=1 Tax=Salinarimonas sp. NSM TaxID=3458003 RepID=UPI0040358883
MTLFSIETNAAFPEEPARLPELAGILGAFGLTLRGAPRTVRKANVASTVVRCDSVERGEVMVRGAEGALADAIEAQCRAVAAVAHAAVVRPLVSLRGGHVVVDGGRAWIAYPRIAGEVLDPLRHDPVRAFDAGLVLLRELGALDDDVLRGMPRLSGGGDLPQEQLSLLLRESFWGGSELAAHVSATTRACLVENAALLARSIDRAAAYRPPVQARAIHNDMQHANIIVSPEGPVFIDIEDVGIGDATLAVGHCAFKIARHAAFLDRRALPRARQMFAGFVARCASEPSLDPHQVRVAAARRIWNDVALIVGAHASGRDDWLYDLEKKLCNALELAVLEGELTWT